MYSICAIYNDSFSTNSLLPQKETLASKKSFIWEEIGGGISL